MTLLAFTRAVSPRLADCQLTHLPRQPFDMPRAIAQHAGYEAALAAAGAEVHRLPPLDDFPDGVFVEDTAVILGDHAIITRPGAKARAGETASTAAGLGGALTLHHMTEGHLDGGDVLLIGRDFIIGTSSRTNRAGIAAFAALAEPLNYTVTAAALKGALHLKTAVTFAGADAAGDPVLLHNPAWVDAALFPGTVPLAVDPAEPFAANVLRVGDTLVVAAGAPRTRDRLASRGFHIVEIATDELQKAECGLTCMSLIVGDATRPLA